MNLTGPLQRFPSKDNSLRFHDQHNACLLAKTTSQNNRAIYQLPSPILAERLLTRQKESTRWVRSGLLGLGPMRDCSHVRKKEERKRIEAVLGSSMACWAFGFSSVQGKKVSGSKQIPEIQEIILKQPKMSASNNLEKFLIELKITNPTKY